MQGDIIETGDDASVSMVLADQSQFSLGADGSMTMDEIVFDADAQEGNALISVTEGVFVFVSGMIAKTGVDAMVIQTPTMTMGIRGTKLIGRAGPEGVDNAVTLLEEAAGHVGEITVYNNVAVQVLNRANETLRVASIDSDLHQPMIITGHVIDDMYGAPALLAPDVLTEGHWPAYRSDKNEDAVDSETETDAGDAERVPTEQSGVLIDEPSNTFHLEYGQGFVANFRFVDSEFFADDERDVSLARRGVDDASAPRAPDEAETKVTSPLPGRVNVDLQPNDLLAMTMAVEPVALPDADDLLPTVNPFASPNGPTFVQLDLIADAWRLYKPDLDPALAPEQWLLEMIEVGALDFGEYNPVGEEDARVLFTAAQVTGLEDENSIMPDADPGYTTIGPEDDVSAPNLDVAA